MTKKETNTSKFIMERGCPSKYIGFQYLRDSIAKLLENEIFIGSMEKTIHTPTAIKYNTSTANVDRCIRTVIKKWWEFNQCGKLFNVSPTNLELLTKYAEIMRHSGLFSI